MAPTHTTLPISRPYFGDEERQAIQRPFDTGWIVQGPEVAAFEQRVAEFTRVPNTAATTSCTTALHIAIAALGLGPGDEVIVPSFTWVSTANVVEYQGATPVFCDVRLDTFNMDTSQLDGLVTERTVGLLPVHLFGAPADMTTVMDVARRRGLWVVEDCACALGTWARGTHAGGFGDAGCFSFHPRKSITTGEGGMIVAHSEELVRTARTLRDHGASRSDHQRHNERGSFALADYDVLGFNYRMTDFQGALGTVQMDRAAWILGERTRLADAYTERLADVDWLQTPGVQEDEVHGWQAYVTVFRPEEPTPANAADLHERRNRLMAALEDEGIATRPGTHAPVETGLYRERYGFAEGQFPNAHLAERLTIALPLYAGMAASDVDRVVEALLRHGPS